MSGISTSKILAVLLLCQVSTLVGQVRPEVWKSVINRDDIEVFSHKYPDAGIRGIKAETSVGMSLDSLVVLLDAVDRYPQWQVSMKETKLVYRQSDTQYHFSSKQKQAWPARDKDLMWATERKWDDRLELMIIDQVCSNNTLPEKNNPGVSQKVFVSWILEPKEDEVKITYVLTVDHRGSIPNWMLTMLNADTPYQMLLKLRNSPDDEVIAIL